MHARSRLHRGFTLIEVMTAVVIVLILAALAVAYSGYGLGRARMNNAVFDVAALINSAQLRARSHGSPHYLFIHQTPDGRVRLLVLERPDAPPTLHWNALDLTQGPEVALNGRIRDQLVLGVGTGPDSGGLAFLDLDSPRIQRPLPAPFSALSLTTPQSNPSEVNRPTRDLMAGCNFCVDTSDHPYGVLRFNADGTLQVMTGNAESGAVIAFAPNTEEEQGFAPKLLTVSAPAGATVVF